MNSRIPDTFTDSLVKHTGKRAEGCKDHGLYLQLNPAQPSLRFHKLERARYSHFSSGRISRSVWKIVLRTRIV